MDAILRAIGSGPNPEDYSGIDFWSNPERVGWLTKQGEYIKTWRRRWFVLKQGKLLWFKESTITRTSVPRGVIHVSRCLTVKGAEDSINSLPRLRSLPRMVLLCTLLLILIKRKKNGLIQLDDVLFRIHDPSLILKSLTMIIVIKFV